MNSFISWIGGKKQLRKQVTDAFPQEGTYSRYIEVFGGAGWVLFFKEKYAELEVFNDIDGELINLYRCTKYHPQELQKELSLYLLSREQFLNCKNQLQSQGLTDIQRAARYFIIIKESFGSDRKSFKTSSRNLNNSITYLTEVSKRLERVIVENIDFEQLIHTYDRENALFYLDPPYYKAEKYYSSIFTVEDHIRLKKCLENIKGKFVLSYNNVPEIKELYKDYNITETTRKNSLSWNGGKKDYGELIIKNYSGGGGDNNKEIFYVPFLQSKANCFLKIFPENF